MRTVNGTDVEPTSSRSQIEFAASQVSKTGGYRSVVDKPRAGKPEMFEIPIDEVAVFTTHLSPRDPEDEAFLRRLGLAFRSEAVRHLMDVEHPPRKIRLCACYPNDILRRVAETCRYEERTPVLEAELISRVCRDYFPEL